MNRPKMPDTGNIYNALVQYIASLPDVDDIKSVKHQGQQSDPEESKAFLDQALQATPEALSRALEQITDFGKLKILIKFLKYYIDNITVEYYNKPTQELHNHVLQYKGILLFIIREILKNFGEYPFKNKIGLAYISLKATILEIEIQKLNIQGGQLNAQQIGKTLENVIDCVNTFFSEYDLQSFEYAIDAVRISTEIFEAISNVLKVVLEGQPTIFFPNSYAEFRKGLPPIIIQFLQFFTQASLSLLEKGSLKYNLPRDQIELALCSCIKNLEVTVLQFYRFLYTYALTNAAPDGYTFTYNVSLHYDYIAELENRNEIMRYLKSIMTNLEDPKVSQGGSKHLKESVRVVTELVNSISISQTKREKVVGQFSTPTQTPS